MLNCNKTYISAAFNMTLSVLNGEVLISLRWILGNVEIRHFVVNANMAVPDNPNFERHDKIHSFFFNGSREATLIFILLLLS